MVIDVSIENREHLAEILKVPGVDKVILAGDRWDASEWSSVVERIHKTGKRAVYAFPFVLRRESMTYYRKHLEQMGEAGFDGYLIRSLDAAGFVTESGLSGLRIFDQGMYTWNSRAIARMRALGADVLTLPYELRQSEMDLRGYEDSQLVVYGRIPVMISAQCTRKTTGQCRLLKGIRREKAALLADFTFLKDRKKALFREDSHCRFCYSVIYNSVPLWLMDRIPAACEQVRFSFTDEAVGEPEALLKAAIRSCPDGTYTVALEKPEGEFTRGHFLRGVE